MSNSIDKMEKIKALKNKGDIQYLLNEAYNIIGNPIMLHDMELKTISHTENIVTDDPIWNQYALNGTISREWVEFYKNEDFFDSAANTKKIAFLTTDKLKYDRFMGKLFNSDGIQIGAAAIEGHTPFADDTSELFECFCDILNEEFAKSDYYRNYGQEYQETLINMLIDGSIEDKGIYTAHVESVYINLKACLYLAVVDVSRCNSEDVNLSHFRDLLKRTQPAFKYSIYSDYIVIIISADHTKLNAKKDLCEFNELFEQSNIYAGISGCFDNLFDLPKYYGEALSALNYGLKSNSNRYFFLYDNNR